MANLTINYSQPLTLSLSLSLGREQQKSLYYWRKPYQERSRQKTQSEKSHPPFILSRVTSYNKIELMHLIRTTFGAVCTSAQLLAFL